MRYDTKEVTADNLEPHEVAMIIQDRERRKNNKTKLLESMFRKFGQVRPFEQFSQLTVEQLVSAVSDETCRDLLWRLHDEFSTGYDD